MARNGFVEKSLLSSIIASHFRLDASFLESGPIEVASPTAPRAFDRGKGFHDGIGFSKHYGVGGG